MIDSLSSYERFLRFDRLTNATDTLRARAVYLLGWSFIGTQIINIFFMTMSYGGWTLDHTVSVAACVFVLVLMHCLRFTKNFVFFALSYSILVLCGIGASSVVDGYTGVNSALLPLLIAGSILNGFIGGWRMVVLYGFMSVAFIWYLYGISASAPVLDGMLVEDYENRTFQRAVQASLAMFLVSVFSGFMTDAINRLFMRLEELIAQVRQSDREKTEFLANMSHELRTPLNGVNGLSRLLLMSELDDKQTEYVTLVNRCGKRLAHIVSNALELSKLDAGKVEAVAEPFDLQRMLNGLVARYKPVAERRGLKLTSRYDANLPTIFLGDEVRLSRAVRNLLSNALKFTPKGSVSLSVEGQEKANGVALEICVKDTGVGIARENRRKIFRRFEQVETGLSRQNDGTGLGLAIAGEFTAFMGGKIRVDSTPGEGSVFTIHLTLPEASEADLAESDAETPQAPAEAA